MLSPVRFWRSCSEASTPGNLAAVSDDPRGASRDGWSGVASGWADSADDRERGPAGRAAEWMVDAVQLGVGGSVLELACGAGDVGFRAAHSVGPEGRVVCSDFAEAMVDVVRERTQRLGLAQVEARVLDAEDPRLERERFDAVLCRFGYMLMADPARALRSSCAALNPGGRLALAVWGPAERNPWLSLVTGAVMKVLGAPPPTPGTPGPFALAQHERLLGLMTAAGFADIRIEDLDAELVHPSLEEWWADTTKLSGPLSVLLRHLSDEQAEAVREDALTGARLRGFVAPDDVVRFPAQVVVAGGRRPD